MKIKIKFLLGLSSLIISFSAFSMNFEGGEPTMSSNGYPEIEFDIPVPGESLFPNERVNLQTGELEYSYVDVFIPGPDGMDIEIRRSYSGHGIDYAFPYSIMGRPWYLDVYTANSLHIAEPGVQPVGFDACEFDTVQTHANYVSAPGVGLGAHQGQISTSSLPAGLGNGVLFENNIFVLCSSSEPRFKMPGGKTVELGQDYSYIAHDSNFYDASLVTKIYDRFGNEINYEYISTDIVENGIVTSAGVKLIDRITRSDGVVVTFSYIDTTTFPKISQISYEGKSVQYQYDSQHRLTAFVDQEGRHTKYTYQTLTGSQGHQYPFHLSLVEIPNGAHIDYQYGDLKGISGNTVVCQDVIPGCSSSTHGAFSVNSKTLNTSDIEQKTVEYSRWHEADKIRVESTESDSSGVIRTSKYEYNRVSDDEPTAISGESALAGMLLKHEVFEGATKVYERINSWSYRKLGTEGCKRLMAGPESYLRCGQALLDQEQHTYFNQGGNDVYTTEYLSYDEYKQPLVIKESNSFSSNQRYTRNTYNNDTTHWLIGRLEKQELSTDGVSWQPYKETVFAAPNDAYKSKPIEDYEYGLLKKEYSYHPNGDLQKVTFEGAVNYREYNNYKRGQPETISYPGRYSSSSVNALQEINDDGTLKSVTDLNGHKTSFVYDDLGRRITVDPNDTQWADTNILYLGDGVNDSNPSKVQLTQSNYRQITIYDGLGRPVLLEEKDLTSGESRYVNMSYDSDGKLVFRSYKSSTPTEANGNTFDYDVLGRLSTITETVTGNQISYDYLSANRVKKTDFSNNVTTVTYLAYGQPAADLATTINSPESVTTTMDYNLFDQVELVQQGGFSAEYVYDQYQRLCKFSRPESGWTYFDYDNRGNTSWMARGVTSSNSTCDRTTVPQASKILYTYDNRDDLWTTQYQSEFTLTSQRDPVGNLLSLSTGTNTWSYLYNSLDLAESEQLTVGSKTFSLGAGYNDLGQVTSKSYPSGNTVNYQLNAFGEPTSIDDYITSASYHADGTLSDITYANGVTYTSSLNSRKLPQRRIFTEPSSQLISDLEYEYDNNINITLIRDFDQPSKTIDMAYDDLDRLTNANGVWGLGSFSYDSLSNITSKVLGNDSLSYAYDAQTNRLSGVSGSRSYTFTYDNRGNVTNNLAHSFSYNLANQLTQSGNNDYEYDGHNRRVTIDNNGQISYSVYGINGKLYHQLGADSIAQDYIYLGSQLIGRQDSLENGN